MGALLTFDAPATNFQTGLRGTTPGAHLSAWYHFAHMQLITPIDIVGDGLVHTLASVAGIDACKWFQFTGISIADSSIPARLGDANVALDVVSPATRGRGITIPQGGGQFCPPIALMSDRYDLTKICFVIPVDDVAQLAGAF